MGQAWSSRATTPARNPPLRFAEVGGHRDHSLGHRLPDGVRGQGEHGANHLSGRSKVVSTGGVAVWKRGKKGVGMTQEAMSARLGRDLLRPELALARGAVQKDAAVGRADHCGRTRIGHGADTQRSARTSWLSTQTRHVECRLLMPPHRKGIESTARARL